MSEVTQATAETKEASEKKQSPFKNGKVNWHRCHVDRAVMKELMKQSNVRPLIHVMTQLGLTMLSGALSWYILVHIDLANWFWTIPLLALALFVHGTFYSFMGAGGPVHELSHKTAFKSKALNEFILQVYSLLSYADYIGFRASHVRHHQVTVHKDYDGEVVLPQSVDKKTFIRAFFPLYTSFKWAWISTWIRAKGETLNDWERKVVDEGAPGLKERQTKWARTILIGHSLIIVAYILAAFLVHWSFLVLFFLITAAPHLNWWLALLCGFPQHVGLTPNSRDFRLCCRTYTVSWLPRLLYWHMNYHVEHHMYPGVPFYNLGRLREAMKADLPPCEKGLWNTWKEIMETVKRQKEDPNYVFLPLIPEGSEKHLEDSEISVAETEGIEAPGIPA
ncbi:MAG: fatty acid desaturase [Verrucomicrobiota bacterium]|nr:fatty acid desaturase [Verrucomicrobiota bacterium]